MSLLTSQRCLFSQFCKFSWTLKSDQNPCYSIGNFDFVVTFVICLSPYLFPQHLQNGDRVWGPRVAFYWPSSWPRRVISFPLLSNKPPQAIASNTIDFSHGPSSCRHGQHIADATGLCSIGTSWLCAHLQPGSTVVKTFLSWMMLLLNHDCPPKALILKRPDHQVAILAGDWHFKRQVQQGVHACNPSQHLERGARGLGVQGQLQ